LFYNLPASEIGIAYSELRLGYEMEHRRFTFLFAAGARIVALTQSV